MKIVVLDANTLGNDIHLDCLNRFGELTVYQSTAPEESVNHIQDSDILITNKVLINKDVISSCPNLKLICISATGTNNVDLSYASERGVVVKNAINYSTSSVAQYTFAALFHFYNQLSYYDRYVKEGKYQNSTSFTHYGPPVTDLSEKKFGIIGLGNIGLKVAEIATAFGAHVIYYSTSGKNTNTDYERVSLEALLTLSDIVSIHAPLNESTDNLINYENLCLMKKSALLINAGRGGITHEKDLARALNEGLIAGACVDVFTKEPITSDNPLLSLGDQHKILLSPHIAWASTKARKCLVDRICENIEAFLQEHDKS